MMKSLLLDFLPAGESCDSNFAAALEPADEAKRLLADLNAPQSFLEALIGSVCFLLNGDPAGVVDAMSGVMLITTD